MSNFSAFDKAHMGLLLEPFAPGMSAHITPIKYEALTPDCFLLLFRTTSQNDEYAYFVSLETDFQNTLEGAECTIEDWHESGVVKFLPLHKNQGESDTSDIENFKAKTSGPYFAMLAEVNKPTRRGYWADSIVIMPGDNIGEIIKDLSDHVQLNIRNALAEVLQHKTDPNASFLDSLILKKQDTVKDDINQTNMSVSLYIQPDESVELFYNYTKPNDTK